MITELFEKRITFNQTLGLKITSVQPDDVHAHLQMRPALVGHYAHGRLHGGVISAALDHIGGLAAVVAIAERHAQDTADQVLQRFARLGTIDMRIDFLRPGLGHSFKVSAEIVRLGGRIANAQMRMVNDEGKLIATGAAAYTVA
jgi:uncharacterized protein (TIGR00369 family)